MASHKKMIALAMIAILSIALALRWCVYWTTPQIIDIHQDGDYCDIVVRHFPIIDKGKVSWWIANKEAILKRCNIFIIDPDKPYHVVVWAFGNGYIQDDDRDRMCFHDMNTASNCITKNTLLIISNSKNLGTTIRSDHGIYRIHADGSSTRLQDF